MNLRDRKLLFVLVAVAAAAVAGILIGVSACGSSSSSDKNATTTTGGRGPPARPAGNVAAAGGAPRPSRPTAWARLLLAAGVLAAEVLALSVRFDAAALGDRADWTAAALRHGPVLLRLAADADDARTGHL